MKDWIEAQIRKGDYASSSDYVRDLVRRDRERREREMSLDELRQFVVEARSSGISTRKIEDIIAEGDRLARARGLLHG
jgi:antitoxin ParD1/3/4